MTKDTVVAFRAPTGFSPDPLTDLLRQGARDLIAQAVEAELNAFLTAHADQTDAAGHRRLVHHGHLPEREVQTGAGAGAGAPGAGSGARRWSAEVHLDDPAALSAAHQVHRGAAALALPERYFHRRFFRGSGGTARAGCTRPVGQHHHAAEGRLVGRLRTMVQTRSVGAALRVFLGRRCLLHAPDGRGSPMYVGDYRCG